MSKARMAFSEALDIVHELASGNRIDEKDIAFGDEGLAAQRAWQEEAMGTFGNLIMNHHEEIDARFPLPDKTVDYDIEQVKADRADDPATPSKCIRISLDLCRDNMLDASGEDLDDALKAQAARQAEAVNLVEDFIVRHGAALDEAMTTLKLPSDFFA